MKTIAERIKEGMILRNMKQVELSKITGISKGALSSYLSNRYIPKQNNVSLIAKALNVSETWLNGYDVPMDVVYSISSSDIDKILFEITSRSLESSPCIYDAIKKSLKKLFHDLEFDEHLFYNMSYEEQADTLNSIVNYVLYNPKTNHIDIYFNQNTTKKKEELKITQAKKKDLFHYFNQLNEIGQEKALENIGDLTYINKYKKI